MRTTNARPLITAHMHLHITAAAALAAAAWIHPLAFLCDAANATSSVAQASPLPLPRAPFSTALHTNAADAQSRSTTADVAACAALGAARMSFGVLGGGGGFLYPPPLAVRGFLGRRKNTAFTSRVLIGETAMGGGSRELLTR
ncbi:hypothetical protein B0H13DRAFT_2653091 [Mycena leptocephala]|nr:hypothetical protein B0H13DRAFT_2653091 [Mycena leptocephala]